MGVRIIYYWKIFVWPDAWRRVQGFTDLAECMDALHGAIRAQPQHSRAVVERVETPEFEREAVVYTYLGSDLGGC